MQQLNYNNNQALQTMQSERSLDWGIFDSALRKTRETSWIKESIKK